MVLGVKGGQIFKEEGAVKTVKTGKIKKKKSGGGAGGASGWLKWLRADFGSGHGLIYDHGS